MESLLLTVPETAALLRVSSDTIRREITAGLIPTKRLRGILRVSRQWVESFCAESAPILLTRRQVSAKLGVSVVSVRTLQRKGLLPTVKIGKILRIPAAAVAEYLKRNSFAFLRPAGKQMPSRPAVSASVAAQPRRMVFSSVRGV